MRLDFRLVLSKIRNIFVIFALLPQQNHDGNDPQHPHAPQRGRLRPDRQDRPDGRRPAPRTVHRRAFPGESRAVQQGARHVRLYRHLQRKTCQCDGPRNGYSLDRHLHLGTLQFLRGGDHHPRRFGRLLRQRTAAGRPGARRGCLHRFQLRSTVRIAGHFRAHRRLRPAAPRRECLRVIRLSSSGKNK